MDALPKLLTTADVAEILAVSTKTVIGLVQAGEIPFIPIGTGKIRPRMRFQQEDIEEFILRMKTRKRPPMPQVGRKPHAEPSIYAIVDFAEILKNRKDQRSRLTTLARTPDGPLNARK